MPEATIKRIKASLSAIACGDCVGKIVSKKASDELDAAAQTVLGNVERGWPVSMRGNVGRVTDDTVLTLVVVNSIVAQRCVSRSDIEARLRVVNPQGGKQIFLLKSYTGPLYVAVSGLTNGCVPRSAALSYFYGSMNLGDLLYDVVKISTLTHGHPNGLAAACIFAVCVAMATDGFTAEQIREALPGVYPAVEAICNGGSVVCQSVSYGLSKMKGRSCASYIDALERALGFSVEANSSAISGICLGLSEFGFTEALATLLRRWRPGWDLDSTAAIFGAVAGALRHDEVPQGLVDDIEFYNDLSFDALSNALYACRKTGHS